MNQEGSDEGCQGREFCFSSAGDPESITTDSGASSISITDVTDKSNVQSIAFFAYRVDAGLD